MDIVLGTDGLPGLRQQLMVATDQKAIRPVTDIDHLVFSGGVSEYLEPGANGPGDDLGHLLAAALRERLASAGLIAKMHPATQRIRATVLGASQFSVQASSQTVYVSDAGALPVHGLQAVEIDARGAVDDTTVTASLHRLDLERWGSQLAAVIRLDTPTTHAQLFQAASALAQVAGRSADPSRCPLYIVLRADMARALGRVLKEEIGWTGPVIVVDGIDASNLDHLDIGEPLGYTGALPVTVTSLQFPSVRSLPVTTGSPE